MNALSNLCTKKDISFHEHHYPILCEFFNHFEEERWEAAYKILMMYCLQTYDGCFYPDGCLYPIYNFIYRNITNNSTPWCIKYKAYTKLLFPTQTKHVDKSWGSDV